MGGQKKAGFIPTLHSSMKREIEAGAAKHATTGRSLGPSLWALVFELPVTIVRVLSSISFALVFNVFLIYIHQHREKAIFSALFSSTSREGVKTTFCHHLFSTTSPDYPSFFPPAFFRAGSRGSS